MYSLLLLLCCFLLIGNAFTSVYTVSSVKGSMTSYITMFFNLLIFGIGSMFIFLFGVEYTKLTNSNRFSRKKIAQNGLFNFDLENIKNLFFNSRIYKYMSSIYEKPIWSEQVLGGFFFGKTLVTTMIAFYFVEFKTLVFIILFTAFFDALTGIYQHTLMNYFHKTFFKNRFLAFAQNLFKRYFVDIFRAEVLAYILLGIQAMTMAEQYHIIQNRLVSGTYYFNAVLIDKLVEMGAMSRNARSKFVMIASSIGGLLCLLDFARTDFPSWIPAKMSGFFYEFFPGPLEMLAIFNFSVFVIAGAKFLYEYYELSEHQGFLSKMDSLRKK